MMPHSGKTTSRPNRALRFSLHRDRLKALWHIMEWVIDQRTHRAGHEFFTRIRAEESFERFYVLKCGVEPLAIEWGARMTGMRL